MDVTAKRYCRKCLTSDMAMDQMFQNMYDYIANLDEDIKADETLYQERLAICKQCDNLTDGMCVKCGCYVEMRAAMKHKGCPDTKHKW